MTVKEFIKYNISGAMIVAVDGDQCGYMTKPTILIEADRNVINEMYGDYTVIGFEPVSKKKINLYIKKGE